MDAVRMDAVRMADHFRVDLRRVWPGDVGGPITAADVLTFAVFGTPDRVLLAEACELPPDAPVGVVRAELAAYLSTVEGAR
jgi:hypothetical protein